MSTDCQTLLASAVGPMRPFWTSTAVFYLFVFASFIPSRSVNHDVPTRDRPAVTLGFGDGDMVRA
ncbi:uncharacterized protein PHACADRAFT_264959 [Phanerochaete carnosa HHB-10118-sp]|uniref:Uncharacterized protein n=1 Tax=Phanerochaete carnosa (strain HHB-10118-sp) TaxID=650164 RepID=K5WJD9_PHACS|nr:uncharacterized protein PHACADRAFT_264959 [Phanerochaete carnosa HHB-10118-sp]EKM50337.1 hypothetical protein PHACADRAFT_264959 [Phanerochaete carnosa HHB-10118-sp]